MKNLIRHIKVWNCWRKDNFGNTFHKIRVLFGMKTPTFLFVKEHYEYIEKMRNTELY